MPVLNCPDSLPARENGRQAREEINLLILIVTSGVAQNCLLRPRLLHLHNGRANHWRERSAMDRVIEEKMLAGDIMRSIDLHVSGFPNRVWSIGITNAPAKVVAGLFGEKADASRWNSWSALSLAAALEVERYYVSRGFRCGGAEHVRHSETTFVYVY